MANEYELKAMRRAIAISAQGLGSTSPNPPVGCVILDSRGRTVGEGYHRRKGESHAEVNALLAAGMRAEGSTAVVTLEPCNHYGRTPPCREALITANVSRVLIAVMDPTSRGEGGAELLRKAGIEVEKDFLKDEALLVLAPWLKSLSNSRPAFTWIHEASETGVPVPSEAQGVVADELRVLREAYDIVIRQGGEIEEGRPGIHSSDIFHLPGVQLGESITEIIDVLNKTGARTVLIEGVPRNPHLVALAGTADRVISYIPYTPPSYSPEENPKSAVSSYEGYRLSRVSRCGDYVRTVSIPELV